MEDTISAISTSLGVGAISIIRISGNDSIKIVNKITSVDLTKKNSHTITHCFIKENDEVIDEVLISIMKSPKTFTKEDIVEINCHGSIATTKKILQMLLTNGCRLATPGEFTKRAFLNGRIDLTESQAVMDLINTKSESARKIAINNLQGKTTAKIKELRNKLLDIISNIEVNIDYPEYQDIEVMTNEKINKQLKDINKSLDTIIQNSKNSKIIKDGINVAIIGKPNVGKSSILNKILGEDKAIVTDIAGTTRDIIEAEVNLDGILLNLIDTAGIRKTNNQVEKIGVNKSLKITKEADLIILVLNNNEPITKEELSLLDDIRNQKYIIVINKNDLISKLDIKKLSKENICYTNTIKNDGLDQLTDKIKELFNLNELSKKDFNYVSNIESLTKLEEAKQTLFSVEENIKQSYPVDIVEIDIKKAWNLLGEIIGETYTEEMLDHLFKNFCVGK